MMAGRHPVNFSSIFNLTDLEESTPAEVLSVTFFVPMSTFLIWMLGSFCSISSKLESVTETLVINLILLLALTSLSSHLVHTFLILALLITVAFYLLKKQLKHRSFKELLSDKMPVQNFNRKFIGEYRGHLLLATAISILAVDFNSFPLRFAKTDTFGWSVMDAGVGSFVLVHGLSSARRSSANHNSFRKCALSSFPLFIIGVIRLAVTTAVGYHKVVPEYGVHWNFFFTLAFVKIICHFIPAIFSKVKFGFFAAGILILHQMLLSKGMTEFILSDERKNILQANKEGVCSLLGFVSIYFCGAELGDLIWKPRYKINEYVQLLIKLCGIGVLGWILMHLFHATVQPTSRRMANLAYCVWVVSLTSLQMALHLFQQLIILIFNQILKRNFNECLFWKAVNYNGLAYFLLANLMTGLVNLTFSTDKCSNSQSFIILVAYLSLLTFFAVYTLKHSIQLKFW